VHGLNLHPNTYVYFNGADPQSRAIASLRNFDIEPELAERVILHSKLKVETHRLGHEMSEDALSWNVFVGLLSANRLRAATEWLTRRSISREPDLYLWGLRVNRSALDQGVYPPLVETRERLERDIRKFWTEPDVMLVIPGELVVCIEAKFGSGNPLAFAGTVAPGEKPCDARGLIERYLDPAKERTRKRFLAQRFDGKLHSQLFRNLIFASEMADDADWHVVNLVSRTLWNRGGAAKYSYEDPTPDIQKFLQQECHRCFSFRYWEDLYRSVIASEPDLDRVARYMERKSAHYKPAFSLN